MGNVRFVPNHKGIREFLTSAPVTALVDEHVQQVAQSVRAASGREEFVGTTRSGNKRAHGMVRPDSAAAYTSNLKHNWLLKALHGGE